MKLVKIKKTIIRVWNYTIVVVSRLGRTINRYLKPLLRFFWRNKMVLISGFNVILTISLMIIVLVKLRANYSAITLGLIDRLDWMLFVILLCLSGFSWQSYRLFNKVKNEKWDKLKSNKRKIRLLGLSIYTMAIMVVAKYVFGTY